MTAEYSLRDDGGIRVVNQGYDRIKQRWKRAEGKAYFIGASDIGKLKVSFFGRRRYFAPRPLKIVVQYLQLCAE